MARLKEGMATVEILQKHNQEIKRRNRKAAIIAGCIGFLCGILFSLLLPIIGTTLRRISFSLPSGSLLAEVADHYMLVTLPIMAAAVLFLSLNAYELSLSLQKNRQPYKQC